PAGLNARTFPAKLWRLLNSPRVRSVRWDTLGRGLLVERSLFERELLSPAGGQGTGRRPGHGPAHLPSTRFASFVRQLYRYGFQKVPGCLGAAVPGDAGPWLHYRNASFRRDRTNLLMRVKRRAGAKKQRLAARQGGVRRPPCSFHL
ncbi:HSF5 protein, partial [Pardalotus punctatus]|nr:HSF5 protein [Pardalotus punctatus]